MTTEGERQRARDAGSTRPQAIVRIVPRGGAKSAIQIFDQLTYLSRNGEVPLQRSERYLSVALRSTELEGLADSWVREAGFCLRRRDVAAHALTTHFVLSFPCETERGSAFAAGRAWAEEMFGSGRGGGTYDYLTACHGDRPHPHVHLVVHRRAFEGSWLKISRRHPELNYQKLRQAMVVVAQTFGIALDASSRAARGMDSPATNYAEYRRQARMTAALDAAAADQEDESR